MAWEFNVLKFFRHFVGDLHLSASILAGHIPSHTVGRLRELFIPHFLKRNVFIASNLCRLVVFFTISVAQMPHFRIPAHP